VKPQSAAYLLKAAQSLDKARRVLAINIADEAGRHAYYAEFHAAQALIFERTDRISKSHKGVSIQFHKLAKADPEIGADLAKDLSATYHFKEAADYEIGAAALISLADANSAILSAERFVTIIRDSLSKKPPDYGTT
jgi:uncharacterized protein (UPF0332 family)